MCVCVCGRSQLLHVHGWSCVYVCVCVVGHNSFTYMGGVNNDILFLEFDGMEDIHSYWWWEMKNTILQIYYSHYY